MEEKENDTSPLKRDLGGKGRLARARTAGGKLFWVWIGYQSIKGVLTLSLFWIPLLLLWLRRG